jgi:osmoprotectant transport system substrate-binding protein
MRFPALRWCGSALVLLMTGAILAGCSSTSSTTSTTTGATTANTVCTAKTGSTLAVLADDKHLEASDNITPIVRTSVAQQPLTDALNQLSAALSQTALINLNVQVETDRVDPSQVASQFVSANNLGQGLSGGTGSITVAAGNFAENETLAAIAADVLNKVGYKATAKTIGQRELYEPAVESNQAQVVLDYAASLTTYLAQKVNSPLQPSQDIDKTITVLKQLATPRGLTVLNPAVATDENAFAVTRATATAYGLKTLSDLAAKCPGGVSLGGPANCPQRPFCAPGLLSTYKLKTTFTAYDNDGPLTRAAVTTGKVFLGVVFSSDTDATPA